MTGYRHTVVPVHHCIAHRLLIVTQDERGAAQRGAETQPGHAQRRVHASQRRVAHGPRQREPLDREL